MKIRVNEHKCEILKTPVNEKELNVTVCEFEFADNITDDYVKEAYFTFKGATYKEIIINNKCDIPPEVLSEIGQVELGVVAYIVENGDELKRYNPSPVYFTTWVGSLKDSYENSEQVTPTDLEQIQSQVAGKQDMLVSGTNIKTINHQSLLGEGNINIQGGSGGSSDYEDLDNKPSINDVELIGNKSLEDLGVQPQGDYALSSEIPSALSELADDSTHRLVTDTEKSTWGEKQDALVSGTNIKTINNESLLGSGNITISGSGDESEYIIPTYCLKTTANFSSTANINGSNFPSDDLQKISDIITDAYANSYWECSLILSSEASQSPNAFSPFFPRGVSEIKNKNTSISFLSNSLVENRYVKGDTRKFSSAQIAATGSWSGDVFTATRIQMYNKVYDMLTLDNEKSFVPTSDYHPATKKYVDDAIASAIANLNN